VSSCSVVSGSALGSRVEINGSAGRAAVLPVSPGVETRPQGWPTVRLGMEERKQNGCSWLCPGHESCILACEGRQQLSGGCYGSLCAERQGTGSVNEPGAREREKENCDLLLPTPGAAGQSAIPHLGLGQSNGSISTLKYLDGAGCCLSYLLDPGALLQRSVTRNNFLL